ncbi:hypothetical protein [Burkholderia vietnamiensis]|uniref:hypothetical protein n=1 Tax=Burkholderia vietnamiensis TaxID=60552 RepID=UPI0010410952|nr:hypothetical protein [Burkholderia vietnamiensis]
MYQYDDPTAAAEMPAITVAGTPGFFTDGNPQTNVPRTVLRSDFMNTVMMELLNVLSAGDVTPDKTKQNQLALAIQNMISAAVTAAAAPEPGDIKLWAGSVAGIPARFGPGWHLADGQNGTINLTDKFVVGAGGTYAVGATGGSASVTLSAAQMPVHNHDVNETPHTHGTTENPHTHGTTETPHDHTVTIGRVGVVDTTYGQGNGPYNFGNADTYTTSSATTGLSVNQASTGLSVNQATTGITTKNAGQGQSIDIRPPYYALCFVQYVGA